jgi:site-specific recombinase XerD
LLERVRQETRWRHMSIRTEETYVHWIARFLRFHKARSGHWIHPSELGSDAVNGFPTSLAVEGQVAASTQNQALSAILFLHRNVLKSEVRFDAARAKKPARLPVVLSLDEVRRLLCATSEGPYRLMAGLMYGAGIRLMIGEVYRRCEEIHHQQLYEEGGIVPLLEGVGFQVMTVRGYGDYRLGEGVIGFIAKRPSP